MNQRQGEKLRKGKKGRRNIWVILIIFWLFRLAHEQNLQVCNKTISKNNRKYIKFKLQLILSSINFMLELSIAI